MTHPSRAPLRATLRAAALATGALLLLAVALPRPARAEGAAPAEAGTPISERIDGAVVKIFAATRRPDLNRPWTRQPQSELTGSGVVIDGHRILTNAHVVAYAGQVQVQADREGDKHSARVAAIAPGMDLALLTLDDDAFFDRHRPLERNTALPQIKDAVLAYGFPVGGSSLSITKGIVSRIEFVNYGVADSGLSVQIDAAINPGNSGGPAVVGDRMVGLAFSTLGGAQNIGYIIPNEEIDLFLRSVAAGRPHTKPSLYDEFQTLENPALRAFLQLDPSVHGLVVHRPLHADPDYPLHEWDVVTSIGGVPVDDQGMILVGDNLRLAMRYRIQQVAHEGHIALGLVRAGQRLAVEVPLLSEPPMMLRSLGDAYPSYFIYGPLVFSRATLELVAQLRNNPAGMLNVVSSPLITQLLDPATPEREELVVLPVPLFPHAIAKGYGNVTYSVVQSVNGVPVRSLRHLVALLRDLKDEYLVLQLDSKHYGEGLVFRRAELAAATEEILSDNGVRAQGTADMMAVWQERPAATAARP